MSVPLQPSQPPQQIASPPVTVILTVILLVFFFLGFFSIYFCRCFMQNLIYTWHLRNGPTGTPVGPTAAEANPGLDPSIISSFPTFTYSSVKDFRKEKYGLECAICLCEFEDDNVLRLLTKCYHVFHQQCIDLWLESHKSCPFCRRGLETPVNSPEKSPESRNSSSMREIQENDSLEGYASYNINIKDENDNTGNEREESNNINDNYKATTNEVIIAVEQDPVDKKNKRFTRSNSTGHSIASDTKTKCREEEDRFTLKLPEHIQAKIIRGHNWTRSCTTFGEYKSKTSTGSGGFGEVSTGDVSKV